ncbi:adenosine deaminase [Capsaspora owczarzaki ATCC 30864]|uniref:Adenosine deaminase n=1 Tax=Capsaspora owczarzaki (strain ATCC 30864) TaxID=595528 RepID=A0A0D2WSK7_CAPO3|nr:adenosine deaminase [Capsaspora owczarzaki ATCC 30864]KJE94453.1 adenosine deaminase [Capsaspora owczarzaki ATCC 30864]|eukprot:XP_004346776.2 adenosine deaminase [Capsaspora owczarzaki ATCC 30864]
MTGGVTLVNILNKLRASGSKRATLVELHCHMDGSLRTSTILDVAQRRGIALPASTVDELHKYVTVAHDCTSLTSFLSTFGVFIPVIRGDAEAIERMAYELCQDQAARGVCYFEARYAPQLLNDATLSIEQVIEAACRGLQRGIADFNIYAKFILCCMRHMPETSLQVAHLAAKYRSSGVVGIDLAGDEAHFPALPHAPAFQFAKEQSIRRTVHAGEAGPAANVSEALDVLHAERIGHGYHIIDDQQVYERVKRDLVHLECCLTSSLQTGAVASAQNHPIVKFEADRLNFSLNSDDPAVCRTNVREEHELAVSEFHLAPSALQRATLNAAEATFLDSDDKALLRDYLSEVYSS